MDDVNARAKAIIANALHDFAEMLTWSECHALADRIHADLRVEKMGFWGPAPPEGPEFDF